jgi:O-antigen ligase
MVVTIFAIIVTRWIVSGTPLFESFERRRNYWIAATVITFGVPNFWLAMLLLAGLGMYAARKDKNPIGVFLFLLLAVPPVTREIEKLGPINSLFALTPMRTLAIAILVPMAYRLIMAPRERIGDNKVSPRVTDIAAVLMFVYIMLLYVPYESITSLMRRAAMMTVDFLLPYFVISRHCRDRATVKDSLGTMLTVGLLIGIVAIFEHFKGWLLWDSIAGFWGADTNAMSIYLVRDGALRAAATAGHQLALGHFLVVCMGLLGIFRPRLTAWRHLIAVGILMLALFSTVSRGPWIGAAAVLLLAGFFTNNVRRYYAILFGVGSLAIVGLLLSPFADKFINLLPFVGTVEQENISYRKEILDTTLLLVRQRPLFGSVMIQDQLEHLRQGQGIIDLVNVYAEFALTYGLIGLGLLVLFLGSALLAALRTCLRVRKADRDLFLMAGNAGVALFGSMVLLAGLSNWLSVPVIYTSLVALLVVTARLGLQVPRPRARRAHTGLSPSAIEPAAPQVHSASGLGGLSADRAAG